MLIRPLHWFFLLTYGRFWMPRRLQIAARQRIARSILARSGDKWPIDKAAGTPPPGWKGWPEGKQFALLLTHDVDTQRGLDRCRALMDMEERLGFRSAFYFVPRGRYEVPEDLLQEIRDRGFEVGVHGLYHDWWTFLSRRVFERRAPMIREHLENWGAAGFRAPSMVRNLDWIRELGAEYDASTFDTDPFEPMPQSAGTIFPFWVDGSGSSPGYVELPYTFPQDMTLFVLLKEKGTAVWERKLRWLARQGGVALLDTHPDYANTGDVGVACDEYPAVWYRSFLEHVRDQYAGTYWHVLPKDLVRAIPHSNLAHYSGRRRTSVTTIWIDLDNTPHVPFFRPIIRELEGRGYRVLVTARDAFQVYELAERMGVGCIKIGRHYGRNRLLKLLGLTWRALQLIPLARRQKPVLAVSHGSRSQIMASNLLGVRSVLIEDYEFAKFPPLMRPTWRIAPDVIPDDELGETPGHVLKYPGIKEDVYVPDFKPDPAILGELGISPMSLIATVRPPATEAHYHNPESEILFAAAMNMMCRHPDARVVLLPRNKRQEDDIRAHWPQWFAEGRTLIPPKAVDGLNLLWHSDLVISGGGTMNREAAALGVPVYSIFRGKMGAVDRHLAESGRLVIIGNVADIHDKIGLVKRTPSGEALSQTRRTLRQVVDQIAACV